MGRDVAEPISFVFVEDEALIIDGLRIGSGAAAIRVFVKWSWNFKVDCFRVLEDPIKYNIFVDL